MGIIINKNIENEFGTNNRIICQSNITQIIRQFVSTAVVLCLSFSIYAQITTATISGYMKDSYGPVADASIIATNKASGVRYYATTDFKGRFCIMNVIPGGPYSIKIQMLGYRTITAENIYVAHGDNYVINEVFQEASFDMDEPQPPVMALSPNSSVANDHFSDRISIDQNTIGTLPTLSHSINDVLKLSPRTFVSDNHAYISGGDQTQSRLTINGMPFNGSYGTGVNLPANGSQLSLDAIEHVSISTTPFDVRQSGFTGGAVNIVTRSGSNKWTATAYSYFHGPGSSTDQQGLSYAADAGIANADSQTQPMGLTYGASTGGAIIRDKLFLFANIEMDNFRQTSVFKDFNSKNPGMKLFGRLDWNINSNNSLSINYLNANSKQITDETNSCMGVSAQMNSRFMEGRLNNIFRAGYSSINAACMADVTEEVSYMAGIHNLLAGVQYEYISDPCSVRNQFSAYLQYELSLSSRFKMMAGVRFDDSVFSPRLGFNWDVIGSRKVIVRGGTGFFASCNVALSMPQLWKSSMAVDVMLPWQVVGTIDGMYARDLSFPGSDRTFGGYYYGATASIVKGFDNGFSARIAYAYGNSWISDGDYQVMGYDPFMMPHSLVASASYRIEYSRHFATTVSLFYKGGPQGRYTYLLDGERIGTLLPIPLSKRDIDFEGYTYESENGGALFYSAAEQKEDFWNYVTQDRYLNGHKGQNAEPYGVVSPWANRFDVRITQDFFINSAGKRHTLRVGFDIFNVGSLLCSGWGREYSFKESYILRHSDSFFSENGDLLYNFMTVGGSRLVETWNRVSPSSVQLSLRYIFD